MTSRKRPAKAILMIAIIAFVLWFGVTSGWRTHNVQLRYRCAGTLRTIGQALSIYRDEKGVEPAALGDLIAAGLISESDLRCPATLKMYNYRTGPYESKDNVSVFEPLGNHWKGSNVLFADGQCGFLAAKNFAALGLEKP